METSMTVAVDLARAVVESSRTGNPQCARRLIPFLVLQMRCQPLIRGGSL